MSDAGGPSKVRATPGPARVRIGAGSRRVVSGGRARRRSDGDPGGTRPVRGDRVPANAGTKHETGFTWDWVKGRLGKR
ncbi:hypothetical protein GCM10027294_11980 [Marinactinospora endophytica]